MKILLPLIVFISFSWATTVSDMFNRTLTITANEKIVAVGPGTLRLLTYMQLQKRLVGVEQIELDFDTKAPYRGVLNKAFLTSLPVIAQGGPAKMPNIEAIIKVNPDIIFTSFLTKQQVETLQEKTGINVVALSYGSNYGGKGDMQKLQAVKASLKLLGDIFDKPQRARELVSFMDENENLLAHLNLDAKAYIGGIGYKGAKGLTSTESTYPPFALLGLNNAVTLQKSGHAQIQLESLLVANPDYIFIDMLGKNIVTQELEKNMPIIKTADAYKKQNVYWLYPYNFYNTNIENVYLNAYVIAQKTGIELDIEAIKNEIYLKFLGANSAESLPPFTYE
jgi:iron complex transport system substrate-binding protein